MPKTETEWEKSVLRLEAALEELRRFAKEAVEETKPHYRKPGLRQVAAYLAVLDEREKKGTLY